MTIWVKGAGALGTRLAVALAEKGQAVVLTSRNQEICKRVKLSSGKNVELSETLPQTPEVVFIATKAFDLESACREILDFGWSSNVPVIPISNGFYDRELVPLANEMKIYCGASTFAGFYERDTFFIQDEQGKVFVNPTSLVTKSRIGDFVESLRDVVTVDKDVDLFRQVKWIINCVVNSMTAAYELETNARVFEFPNEMRNVFGEAVMLAQVIFAKQIPDVQSVWDHLNRVVESTSRNKNSMYLDKTLGKQTEVDYLSGIVLDRKRYPALLELTNKIKN